jgi:hypothetical protein
VPTDPVVNLREYFERILAEKDTQNADKFAAADKAVSAALAAQEKATAAAFAASEKQVAKAEGNAEKWRENANEWRASMLDREVRFASRSEMDAELKAVRAELMSLKESRDRGDGRSSGSIAMWGYVVGGFGFAALLIQLFRALKP